MTKILSHLLSSVQRPVKPNSNESSASDDDILILLAHLHCLPSTVALFTRLWESDLNLELDRIILIPKPYSTIKPVLVALQATRVHVINEEVVFGIGEYDSEMRKLLNAGCEQAQKLCNKIAGRGKRPRLILVDDGGMLTEIWWQRFHNSGIGVVSVQQTASGVRRRPAPSVIPKIDVSRSAAKRHFEAKIISSGVLRKVASSASFHAREPVGIVGVGALGTALAKELIERGVSVFLYDERGSEGNGAEGVWCSDIAHMLLNCRVIFGCTGSNFIDDYCLEILATVDERTFVSCSSRDIEFLNLIRGEKDGLALTDPFERVRIRVGEKTHYVVNGGFPINFDRSEEQETSDEISLTRGLVLAGILQAASVDIFSGYSDLIMLSPEIQRDLVRHWLELTGLDANAFGVTKANLEDLEWWIANSSGIHIPTPISADAAPVKRKVLDQFKKWLRRRTFMS